MTPVLRMLRQRDVHIGMPKQPALAAVVTSACLALLVAALLMPLWLPRTIRRIIPDRYINAYAPKSVQDIVFQRNTTSELLPTVDSRVAAADNSSAQRLLSTATPAPTSVAAILTPGAASTQDIGPVSYPGLPASFTLKGFTHTYQGWNNCGPATLTMTLSYWGIATTQKDVAGFVKPNPEDRNVRPDELARFVDTTGLKMIVRVNGSIALLKRLIASGYPPMIEQGFDVEKLGWMGHYVLLTAYSDARQMFTAQDSYLGPDHGYTYADIEKYWWHFDRTYLVVYRPDQASEVDSIIGSDVDDTAMWNHALQATRQELDQNANDAFGWFNLGSSLTALGNYQDAAVAFDQARTLGLPWRMLWYQFGPYESYLAVGRYSDVRDLADTTLADDIYSEEAYYYKGRAYAAEGKLQEARAQFETALLYNKHYQAAQSALNALGQ